MTVPRWLSFPQVAPFENLRSAGVAITPTTPGRWHAGMLHKEDGKPVMLLHLAWDHVLLNKLPDLRYAWVQLELPQVRLRSVAAMCRRVAKLYAMKGRGLPYALRYKETVFHTEGKMLLGESEHGLTCATFILALLKSLDIELLKLLEWPRRADDVERHRELLKALEDDERVSRDHVAAVRTEVDCVRYRPEEVVGACSSSELPVAFVYAEAAGEQIIQAFSLRTALV